MGSAQLDFLSPEPLSSNPEDGPADSGPVLSGVRLEAAERLRAHRERRRAPRSSSETQAAPRETRQNSIAAAVAERFAQSPSYRAFLAEEAERTARKAAEEAEAAAAQAEVAARNAQAIAAVQQELLAELELWTAPQAFTPETARVETARPDQIDLSGPQPTARGEAVAIQPTPDTTPAGPKPEPLATTPPQAAVSAPQAPVRQLSTAGLTIRLYEDLGGRAAPAAAPARHADAVPEDQEESLALDEEIAFRHSPEFEPFSIDPPTPLPANLLAFPRQLVATRKARPRYAEGPLLEEQPRSPQLRIFEVEPEQISTAPEPVSPTPEWASIHLDATPAVPSVSLPEMAAAPYPESVPAPLAPLAPIQTAPFSLRAMAVITDLLLMSAALLAFVAVAAHIAHAIPTGIPALMAAGGTLAVFYVLFQLLFFTLSDQTPGMRYARIGFCTLSDENPSRAAIRRRLLAQLIALVPFGLGFLWAFLDEDRLGWHDRISRMYPRAY